MEVLKSRKKFEEWKEWRLLEIKKDIHNCHPKWPDVREKIVFIYIVCFKKTSYTHRDNLLAILNSKLVLHRFIRKYLSVFLLLKVL